MMTNTPNESELPVVASVAGEQAQGAAAQGAAAQGAAAQGTAAQGAAAQDVAMRACAHLLAGNARDLLPLITPVLEAMGYALVRLRLHGESGKSRVLQVMVEPQSSGQLTLKDCTEISHALSAALDAQDPIVGRYRLEVSSPGLERPLTRWQDFTTYAQRFVVLQLTEPLAGSKNYRGILQGLRGTTVELRSDESHALVAVPLAQIHRAQLGLSPDDIRASLHKAKQARKDKTHGGRN